MKEKSGKQEGKEPRQPEETLGAVLESAKQAVGGAAPSTDVSRALQKLHGRIGKLSATDQFAAHMAIGSLLTTK